VLASGPLIDPGSFGAAGEGEALVATAACEPDAASVSLP
jgi:hypothetical protein